MVFYRSIFSRLIANFGWAFLVLLLTVGILADRFLADREMLRLESELARAGRAASIISEQSKVELQERIKKIAQSADIRITVISKDGQVLADSAAYHKDMENHADRPEIIKALQGLRGVSQRRSATLDLDMLYVAIPTDPIIRTARPVSEVTELLSQIRRRIILACMPALLLAIGLSYAAARVLSRRIAVMEEFASKLIEGNYGESLSTDNKDELGSLEDRLERLRLELQQFVARLSQDKRQLASILNGLPEAVILFKQNGTLVEANSSACQLFRLSMDNLKEQAGADVIRHPEVLDRLARACNGNIEEEQVRIHWPEPVLELDFSLHKVTGMEGGNGILAVFRDVTHEAHLELVRTDFIANMAHELRTPLTAIRGAAETLLNTDKVKNEIEKRFLGTIHRHSIRLGNILADISQLAHLESGVAPIQVSSLEGGSILNNVADLFRIEAERAKIAIKLEIPRQGIEFVSDDEKIESILVNLLQNSIRYTPAGGTITLRTCKNPDGLTVFEVRDTGIGIPRQDIPRVTERFYRVDAGRSREAGGTGLGLSIVKHLVSALKGRIEIASEYGRGTTVRVLLPSLKACWN